MRQITYIIKNLTESPISLEFEDAIVNIRPNGLFIWGGTCRDWAILLDLCDKRVIEVITCEADLSEEKTTDWIKEGF